MPKIGHVLGGLGETEDIHSYCTRLFYNQFHQAAPGAFLEELTGKAAQGKDRQVASGKHAPTLSPMLGISETLKVNLFASFQQWGKKTSCFENVTQNKNTFAMGEEKAIKAHPKKNIFLLHFLSLVSPTVGLPHSTNGCQKLYSIQLEYLNLSHVLSIRGN